MNSYIFLMKLVERLNALSILKFCLQKTAHHNQWITFSLHWRLSSPNRSPQHSPVDLLTLRCFHYITIFIALIGCSTS